MLQAPNLLRSTIEASIRSTPVDRSLNSSIDAQLHSTLDLLHDVLFNSTIYRQAERSDPTEVLTKISGWRGIAEYHPFEATIKDLQLNDFEAVSKQTEAQAVASKCNEYQLNRVKDYSEFIKFAAAKQQQALDKQAQQSARDSSRKNAAATEYLRISRALEAPPKSASVIRKIAALLGAGKVSKGRSIAFGTPVKLVPLTAAQAVECLSLFLIWPRELSLYAVSDGTNSRVASSVLEFFETQVVSSKPGFTLKGAHYTNADAGSPCCCLCSKESHFLVDGKQCARCILLTHFGKTLSAANTLTGTGGDASGIWPMKGMSVPYTQWITEGCPFRYVTNLLFENATKLLAALAHIWSGNLQLQLLVALETALEQQKPHDRSKVQALHAMNC